MQHLARKATVTTLAQSQIGLLDDTTEAIWCICTLGVKLQQGYMEKVRGIFQFWANYPFDLDLNSCCQNIILCNIFRAFQRNSGDTEEYCSRQNVIKCPVWCSFRGKTAAQCHISCPLCWKMSLRANPHVFPGGSFFFTTLSTFAPAVKILRYIYHFMTKFHICYHKLFLPVLSILRVFFHSHTSTCFIYDP